MQTLIRSTLLATLVGLGTLSSAFAASGKIYEIDRVLGSSSAPITILEYGSPTSAATAAFHRDVWPQLMKDWLNTGKARLIYRDLPTSPTKAALAASMLAHCAGPARYFSLLSTFMDNQSAWSNPTNYVEGLKKLAVSSGMAEPEVDLCFKNSDPLVNSILNRANDAAREMNVKTAPKIFINGKLYDDDLDYADFSKALKGAFQ